MPRVIFKKMTLKDNINFIKEILNEPDNEFLDVYQYTINLFPELKNISNIPLEEKNKLINDIVTKYYHNSSLNIDRDIKRYNDIWSKYNDLFFDKLTNFLKINWPKDHYQIEVTVGIIPVCPRYLETFTFSVHDNLKDEQLIETCSHELCHFLWFEKWKKLYPTCSKEECESPHYVWQYSEAVVDPLLEASKIKKLINCKNRLSYDIFYKKYGNLMNELNSIYQKDIDIDSKIKEGFNYYSKKVKEEK